MLRDIEIGFKTFFKAISFISKNKLSYFYLFPMGLSLIILWYSSQFREDLETIIENFLLQKLSLKEIIDQESFLNNVLEYTIVFLVWVLTIYIWIKINRYVVLILLSPVLSILSEKTERIITGRDYPFSIIQVLKDVRRGIYIAFRNIFLEFSIVGVCFLLSFFFPVLSPLTLPFVALVSWYFMGFSFYDYNLERRKLSHWESHREIWNRKGVVLIHGGLFTNLAYIPIFGVAFGSMWATVAAALAVNEERGEVINRQIKG